MRQFGTKISPASTSGFSLSTPASSSVGFTLAAPTSGAGLSLNASTLGAGAASASSSALITASGAGPKTLELERKPLDQIYKDWDKEDREMKAKFKEHCVAMQELEAAELASQTQIERLNNETKALERRQDELGKFIKNNVDTQSALAEELADTEKKLDDMLARKESAALQAQMPKMSDATARRTEMYEEALDLDTQVDRLSRQVSCPRRVGW